MSAGKVIMWAVALYLTYWGLLAALGHAWTLKSAAAGVAVLALLVGAVVVTGIRERRKERARRMGRDRHR